MTLTELRYVVAVARERHFGKAAEGCFVSQPTLSVAVRKLEDELGVTLFERSSTEVTVTPTGDRVVEQARRVLEEVEKIRQAAHSESDQLARPLRLGLIHTVGPYLLPHLVPSLREAAPKMSLLIEQGYTAGLARQLKHGLLDAVILSLPFEQRGILTWPLYDEPFVVLLPASHPWVQRSEIPVRDLPNENVLLLGEGHCFRDQVLRMCPECQRSSAGDGDAQRTLEGDSLNIIRYMVASGTGLSVFPALAAAAEPGSDRLLAVRRFAGAAPSRRIAVAWRKSFPRPKAIAALRDAVVGCHLDGALEVDAAPPLAV